MAAFQIGTNVYVGLYNKGRGVVFNIKGEQNTKDIKNFGIFSSGGSAEIDIVFEDGTAFTNTPECIAQGYPKLDQISTQEEIDELVANLHFQTQLRNKKEEEDKIKFNNDVELVKTSPEYAHLKTSNKPAQNIRADLKKHFPGVKFSVTSDYSSVRVNWTDGPKESDVNALLDKYEEGKFNGMDDCYHSIRTPFNKVFDTVKYIFTRRQISDDKMVILLDTANKRCGTSFTLEQYQSGNSFYNEHFRSTLRELTND